MSLLLQQGILGQMFHKTQGGKDKKMRQASQRSPRIEGKVTAGLMFNCFILGFAMNNEVQLINSALKIGSNRLWVWYLILPELGSKASSL